MENNLNNNVKSDVGMKILLVIAIIVGLLVSFLLAYKMFIYDKKDNNQNKDNDVVNKDDNKNKDEISINSKEVLELFTIVKGNSVFHKEGKVMTSALSDEDKLRYTYDAIERLGLLKTEKISSCDYFKNYKDVSTGTSLKEMCEKNKWTDMNEQDFYGLNINKQNLMENYLFGNKEDLPLKTFNISKTLKCIYREDVDDFLCYNLVSSGSTSPFISYESAYDVVKTNDTIELYTNYLLCDRAVNENNCYADSESKKFVGKIDMVGEKLAEKYSWASYDDLSQKYNVNFGQKYKFVFKLRDDGKYYLYSSEQI